MESPWNGDGRFLQTVRMACTLHPRGAEWERAQRQRCSSPGKTVQNGQRSRPTTMGAGAEHNVIGKGTGGPPNLVGKCSPRLQLSSRSG